ncbi:hypothetical protein [Paraburkholderia youngii]|uniref:hypothetical protein n=1 Tax=Paraburkholderia youngii TaxID=2782701 RepID=UPI003D192FAA
MNTVTEELLTEPQDEPLAGAQKPLLTEPKNQGRVDEIRTNVEVRDSVFIRSPMIRRWYLREFNFVTSRLYLLTKTSKSTREHKKKLNELLDALNFEAEMLEGDTEFFKGEINEQIFPGAEYPVRLISREANLLLKAITRADESIAKLYMSEFSQMLNKEKRESLQEGFTAALVALKQFSMGYVQRSLEEQVDELKIG